MQQIPVIKKAKELGCYTVTCDYLPDNPGHVYADEYYNVSTTDKEHVLELAKKLHIDGIVAYASDPSAPTAAYVSEKMGLPGNPYESVRICTQKDLFREFLKRNGFNTPRAKGYNSYDEAIKDFDDYNMPVMVKPVDSSGSKGVVKVCEKKCFKEAVNEALEFSKMKRFVVEEFIEKKGYQISGDGFSVDGKLVFTSYGNELYSENGIREYVALGEFWPSFLSRQQKEKVDNEIQRLINALGMRTGAYNIEVIIDKNDNIYILELGPRNGGSYIPQLIQLATGVDLVKYTILGALGEDCSDLHMVETNGIYSNYMILSTKTGKYKYIDFEPHFFENNLIAVYCTAKENQNVGTYKNTADSLGTIIFKANTISEMEEITKHMENYYKVIVE